jgi:flagellin
MSLGVLNNLSAVYAENYLNNTNNSLNTVLQQLSSGSKINSGADDAAGLSLVNGLQANQQALNQSQTNAQEGSGLLQVADGALSQVTSLLNRAVTLATEASNGTLNSTQDTAANQEYQSILSEVSNIGSTTTFNQEQVFGSNTNIYTGDSTQTGASIDALNIRSLSASNLGDTGGAMAYSSGSSGGNVFIDLSNNQGTAYATVDATLNDTLNSGGTTKLTINTLSNNGTVVPNVITVGGTSGFANTAQGMVNAINASGLGVTASFTTAAVAGDPTSSTTYVSAADTGIMISGSVGAGTSPSQNSFSGVVAAAGNTVANLTAMTGGYGGTGALAVRAGDDIMSGTISLQVGNNAASTVTTAQVAAANNEAAGGVTMAQVASYITADAGLGVTATVDGTTGALDLQSAGSTAALKVNSNLTDNTLKTSSAVSETTNYTATAAYSNGLTTGTYATTGITDSAINFGGATLSYSTTGHVATAGAAGSHGTAGLVGTLTATGTNTLKGLLTITDTGTTAGTVSGTAAQQAAGIFNSSHQIVLGIAGATDTLSNLAATLNTAFATDSTDAGATGSVNNDLIANYSAGSLTISETAAGVNYNDGALATVTTANTTQTQSLSTADSIVNGTASSSSGVATISYTDGAGQSLSATDLINQNDAEAALTNLNSAIADVAAQDGYIGAQINTLDAVSQVLSTQSENVQSAQNTVQSTDYASATSNMSKYEILSQTGIAALAQANSQQQAVLKLLQ